jgi:uncharacterized protein YcfJ
MKKLLIFGLFLGLELFGENTSYTEYVNVVQSKPTYENVVTRVPTQQCHDEMVPKRYNSYQTSSNYNDRRVDSGSAIVGGVIGGVLGHQIGKGHGKDVATIGGAILGSLIGQNSTRRSENRHNAVYDSGYNSSSSCQTRRVCKTIYSERSERKFMGYKNIGYYKGRKIVKYSNQRLNTIPVHVSINY